VQTGQTDAISIEGKPPRRENQLLKEKTTGLSEQNVVTIEKGEQGSSRRRSVSKWFSSSEARHQKEQKLNVSPAPGERIH